jgi:serine protease AprX
MQIESPWSVSNGDRETVMSIQTVTAIGLALLLAAAPASSTPSEGVPTAVRVKGAKAADYIVRGPSVDAVRRAVLDAGGQVTATLGIIDAVGARLTAEQRDEVAALPGLRVHADGMVQTDKWWKEPTTSTVDTVTEPVEQTVDTSLDTLSGTTETVSSGSDTAQRYFTVAETHYPALVGADALHGAGNLGQNVTVAVIDTGMWAERAAWDIYYQMPVEVDATKSPVRTGKPNNANQGFDDANGHGTHVGAIIASPDSPLSGVYEGVAPRANLIPVKAFDQTGAGSYIDVIRAIDWVVAHRDKHNIRVLNLSFGAEPRSHYWDDPLNQAVMRLWQAGVVVVASSGNTGPDPMTVNVPGNVPYVITVGAMSDNYTPHDGTDDLLASFSSAGPTYEGFVKPDIVAPGGHVVARMSPNTHIAQLHGSMSSSQRRFAMSGTSQAAAVVSGVAALMLQDDPTLTPDDVKCRLMSTARPALYDGLPAYSVFQQGAGIVNARRRGATAARPAAPTRVWISWPTSPAPCISEGRRTRTNGNFYLMQGDTDGYAYDEAVEGDGYTWSQGYTWSAGLHLVSRLYLERRATSGRRATPGARAIPGARATSGRRATSGPRAIPTRPPPP